MNKDKMSSARILVKAKIDNLLPKRFEWKPFKCSQSFLFGREAKNCGKNKKYCYLESKATS